ncbi:MAG: electron transfer flavoprotein subunit alpha/FixB family protein [Pseudobdellovibrionaceae bacterium]
MSVCLVYIETAKDQIKRSSLELLHWADAQSLQVCAVTASKKNESLTNELQKNGADQIYFLTGDLLNSYNAEAYVSTLVELSKKLQPEIILSSTSALAKDLFPRVAAKLEVQILNECIDLQKSSDTYVATKPYYSGKVSANVRFSGQKPFIVLMRPNQWSLTTSPLAKNATVQDFPSVPVDLKALLKEVVKGTSEKLDLTEANIIVSGGRGLKEAANFKLLQDLAQVLGATVGASRAVVDAGWVPHEMQVGQTGKTVAPSLYIAVGISGAIQHLAGMSGSKVVVAINSDPGATIFQKSAYGIVGDALQILPLLTEEFKKALHQ